MTIEKRGKSWRISQTYKGVRYRVTVDHRPTNAEALQIMAETIKKPSSVLNMTLKDAMGNYIDSRVNIVSPSTIRGYNGLIRAVPDRFGRMYLSNISQADFQTLVNGYAKDHSPKSVRNLSGFISAVLRFHGVRLESPTLPMKEKKAVYIPTFEEVKQIFDYLEGSPYLVPIMLSANGLRKSEVCALTLEDLDGTTLHINKALVQGSDGWVVKSTKTTDSTRDIEIPQQLADMIREQGFAYQGYPNQIYKALIRAQDALGIPHFSLHKMRHFYASYLHSKGIPDKNIQDGGGWKTGAVMKTVYQHAMEQEKIRSEIAGLMSELSAPNLPQEEKKI